MAPLTTECTSEPTDTVIFVDVDGVLNVGARDRDDAPLLFNQSNIDYAMSQRDRRLKNPADQACVEKLIAVAERSLGHGEDATFTKLACGRNSHISEVLAGRLASLIKTAGEHRSVVLSSNWRRPQHGNRVRRLEADVTHHLGSSFTFDARTRQADEKRAGDRLRCIGDYVESLYSGNAGGRRLLRPLRVLVLEDFFITPLDGWDCDGLSVGSAAAAEAYLRGRAPAAAKLAVKLVHTYDEWTTDKGVSVQVGAGLTMEHFLQAQAFLQTAVCPQSAPEVEVSQPDVCIEEAISPELAMEATSPCKASPCKAAAVPEPVESITCLEGAAKPAKFVAPPRKATQRADDTLPTATSVVQECGRALVSPAATATLVDARWADYLTSAWPWLAVYLPCAA